MDTPKPEITGLGEVDRESGQFRMPNSEPGSYGNVFDFPKPPASSEMSEIGMFEDYVSVRGMRFNLTDVDQRPSWENLEMLVEVRSKDGSGCGKRWVRIPIVINGKPEP